MCHRRRSFRPDKLVPFYVRQSVLTGQRDMYFSIRFHTMSMSMPQANQQDLRSTCGLFLFSFSSGG